MLAKRQIDDHPAEEPAMETKDHPSKRLARSAALGTMILSVLMLVSIVVPQPAAEASAFTGSPCPFYSIQDVFDDPSGNWDGDQVNNSDELYNGMNPCRTDTADFCAGGGNALCTYVTHSYTYNHAGYPAACAHSINAFPTGDYDGDGIRNDAEIRQGANPCRHPCPNPTNADLALNPNGSWDNDGISNAVEVWQGTNPCVGVVLNPCPHYTYAYVNAQPSRDWDGDGIANATEVRQGTNPCIFNTVQRLPHVVQQPATSYVVTPPTVVYVAPAPVVAVCPHGYPYYNRSNHRCYAYPIGHFYSY